MDRLSGVFMFQCIENLEEQHNTVDFSYSANWSEFNCVAVPIHTLHVW